MYTDMPQGRATRISFVDIRQRFELGHEGEDLLVGHTGFIEVGNHLSLQCADVGRIHSKALGDEVSNDGGYGSTIGAHLGG